MTNREPSEAMIEAVAMGIYAIRPFCMATTETTQGHQMARAFEWDGAPHYYQEDMRQLARAAILAMEATKDRETASPASEGLSLHGMPAVHPYAVVRYRRDGEQWRVTSVEQTEIDPEASPTPRDTLVEAVVKAAEQSLHRGWFPTDYNWREARRAVRKATIAVLKEAQP